MEAKIRVHGKSQSRTVLGIINAYLKLNPDVSLLDLQQAFPQSLNPKSFTNNIIVPEKETKGNEKQFFERENELIVLKNGKKLALVEVWAKEEFNAICEHAKQYGIVVAEFETTKPFEKGSYDLEYLGGFLPEEVVPKRKCKCWRWWLWIILLILLLLILLFCWKKCSNKQCFDSTIAPLVENVAPEVSTAEAINGASEESAPLIKDAEDAVRITLPDGSEWNINKNSPEYQLFTFLNSDDAKVDPDKTKGWLTLDKLRFETGKAKLASESEAQLKNIAAIMKFFSNAQIKLGGYTDNTGTDAVNKRISAERAKIVAEKLITLGLDSKRINHEGYGSQHPVCPANDTDECRAANRRVDVRVNQK